MSRYHVKADGSMGRCTAKEGHCPFGGDSGTKHFTNESEAQAYAEKIIKNTTDQGGMKKMTKTKDEEPITTPTTDDDEPKMTTNSNGLKVTTWPPERGVHSATYLGWKGYDEIINAGGWISGELIRPTDEIGLERAWRSISPDVKDELDPYLGGDPAEWNGKILELEKSGDLSPEDEELLDAFWIEGEVFNGSVTIYGRDNDVSEMDEDDLERLGLDRMDSDELWRMGIVDDDDEDEDEDEDE